MPAIGALTPQLTRKLVSDMYYRGELEAEIRHPAHPERRQWAFTCDSDRNKYMEIVIEEQGARKYAHSPTETCKIRGESQFTTVALT